MRDIVTPFLTALLGFAAGYYASISVAFRQRLWAKADRLREGFKEEIEVFSPEVDPRGRNYPDIVRARMHGHQNDAEDFGAACAMITRFRFTRVWNTYRKKAEEVAGTDFPTEAQRAELYALMQRVVSFTRKRKKL